MPAKDPRLYLIHIQDSCRRILDYTASLKPGWTTNPMVLDAVCRNLEIIGEANRLDDAWRSAHPAIPWRSIMDARIVLIHAYDQIKPHLLEDIVDTDIPMLLDYARRILAEDSSEAGS